MQIITKNKPSFLKQIVVFEIVLFALLMVWYMHRLSTIDTLYVATSLNENEDQIRMDIEDYLDDINASIKKVATQIVKDPNNIAKSIESLRRQNPKLPISEVSWLGAEDRYMTLSGIDHYLNRNLDESLIRRGIETPWMLVIGGKTNYVEGAQAVFSVTSSNEKYLGSFLLLLDINHMKKALDATMRMSEHPELSYAVFSNRGDVVVSSSQQGGAASLHEAVKRSMAESSEALMLPKLSIFGLGYSHQIKNISVLGREYKFMMMVNHRIAFERSIHRWGFVKVDLLVLCGIFVCMFFFVRYRFILPIIKLSKAANMLDSGGNKIYVEDYATKELADLSYGVQSLITKQHKLIDSKNKLGFVLKQLEGLKRERAEFARNIQHTLRTPIGHIIGGSEVLLSQFMKKVSPDAMEYLNMINESGQELLTTVNNIIAASDLKAGNIKLEEMNCDVKKVIEGVLSDLSPRMGQSQISLNANIANLPAVYIDPTWFGTAIFNIVDNAIKFSKAKGSINIVAKRTAAGVIITIEDNGKGISSSQLRSIEEMLENSSASKNIATMEQGVGLGLTIAHHILDLHDASLSIDSTEGVGTKVTIIIPNIRIK